MKTKPTISDIKAKINELDQMLKDSGSEYSALINIINGDDMSSALLMNVDMDKKANASRSWVKNIISLGCMMRAIDLCKTPNLAGSKQALKWCYSFIKKAKSGYSFIKKDQNK